MSRIWQVFAAIAAVFALSLSACSTSNLGPKTSKLSKVTATSEQSGATPRPRTNRTASLSVGTTTLEVGKPIKVRGNECPGGYWASANLVPSNPKEAPAIFDTYLSTGGDAIETQLFSSGSTRVTSSTNGTWTIDATVPMVFPGSAMITASCVPAATGASPTAGFLYRPTRVSVSTPYTLSVHSGTTVVPGSTLTVGPNGGGCPAPAVTPIVALYLPKGEVTQVVATTMGETQSGALWQANLVIPPQVKAGQYQLEADCDYSRGAIYGSYAPVQITG